MDKWKEFGSYERWKDSKHASLKQDYDSHIEKTYDWVQPDTYTCFDDFCMGIWQGMD